MKGKAATLNNMAGVLEQRGDIDQALEFRKEDLRISRQIGDVRGTAITLVNLAQSLIAHQQDFDTAISYLEEAVVLYEKIRDPQTPMVRQMLEQTRQMQQVSQSPLDAMLMGLMEKMSQNPELQAAMQTENAESLDLESLLEGIDLEALRILLSDHQEE